MKWFVIAAIVAVALFAWSLSRLSPDAVAMALGMLLGVLAGVPTAALVLVVNRRGDQASTQDYRNTINVQPTYADEVTPYTHGLRKMTGMPALPERRTDAEQIVALRTYLEHLEGGADAATHRTY